MATTYTETPGNYSDIASFVKSDVKDIKRLHFFLLIELYFMMPVHFKNILI